MKPKSAGQRPGGGEDEELIQKIDRVLAEARIVLPGVQALLGFQLSTVLMASFGKLPGAVQGVHLASLLLTGLCVALLMTPAAYHRIAEHGDESERFHRLASRLLLVAMAALPLGLAGDVFVLLAKVSRSPALSGALAGATALMFYALWFALPLVLRRRRTARLVVAE